MGPGRAVVASDGSLAAPNWNAVRMLDPHAPGALDASGSGVLVQGGLLGYEPVPFSYLMISVNKA